MSLIRYSPVKGYYNLGVQIKNPGPAGAAGPTGPAGPTGAGSTNGPTGTIAFFNSLGSLTGSSALTFVRTTDTVTGTTGITGPTNLITLDGSMLPALNNVYSLGASGMYWRDVYVGTGTIFMGDEISLSVTNGALTLKNTPQNNSVTLGGDGITFGSSGSNVTISTVGGAVTLISNTGPSINLTHEGITDFILTDTTVQDYISTIGGPTGPRGSSFFYGSSTGTLTGTYDTPLVGDFWINTVTGDLYVKK